jgi:hypothetical protein
MMALQQLPGRKSDWSARLTLVKRRLAASVCGFFCFGAALVTHAVTFNELLL